MSNSCLRSSGRYWILLVIVGVGGLVGYFGPWVSHRAAGLIITGLDLAEYVKFIPKTTPMRREIFYLPLIAASLIASMIASRRFLPAWLRMWCGLSAIPLALAMLPPAWTIEKLQSPMFRLQSAIILFCLVMIPLYRCIGALPNRFILSSTTLLAISAAILPAWKFWCTRPVIQELYRQPIPVGWGLWATMIGFLGIAALAHKLSRESDSARCA